MGLFAFGFYLGLLPLALALAWVFPLLAFWCGKLLEGKRITEEKRMAKEGLIESLHLEL
jgi:hypothetical protein